MLVNSTTLFTEIQDKLFEFMESFDNKSWDKMANCLSEQIYCDYSSFRNDKPGTINRTDYVNTRKKSISHLQTQHNLCNLKIKHDNKVVTVKCNYIIYRFLLGPDNRIIDHFHSYGNYEFSLEKIFLAWKICSIKQILIANDGNSTIHNGIIKPVK